MRQSLRRKIRAWREPGVRFIILHDQDNSDCFALKQELLRICAESNRHDVLIRIVCRELESWYLGNLPAVEKAFQVDNLNKNYGNKRKFQTPDDIVNPSAELRSIVPTYRKVSGSRAIGRVFEPDNVKSNSFKVFIAGLKKLVL